MGGEASGREFHAASVAGEDVDEKVEAPGLTKAGGVPGSKRWPDSRADGAPIEIF